MAGGLHLVDDRIGVHHDRTQLGQQGRHGGLPRPDAPGQPHHDHVPEGRGTYRRAGNVPRYPLWRLDRRYPRGPWWRLPLRGPRRLRRIRRPAPSDAPCRSRSRRRDATGATRSPPSARPSSASASARPPSPWPCRPARSATPTAPSCCGAPRSVAYNVFRVIRPLRVYDDTSSLLRIIAEVAIHVLAVVATGYWDSPLVFSLLTAIMVAGFARGFGFAVRIGAVSALAVVDPRSHPRGLQRRRPPHERPVDERAPARRAHRRLRPPGHRRGRPAALARPRPARPAVRRQRAAVLAPPGRPEPAGLARPRRGARLDDAAGPRPVPLRHRGAAAPRRLGRRLGGGALAGHQTSRTASTTSSCPGRCGPHCSNGGS